MCKLTLTTLRFVTLTLLLASSSAMANKVYKWVDEDGVVHYGTRAPAGKEASTFTPKTGHSEPVKYDYGSDKEDNERTVQSGGQEERVTESNPERCEIARNNLKTLSNFGRVKVKTDDGSFRYLEKEEMQERIEEAEQMIAEAC